MFTVVVQKNRTAEYSWLKQNKSKQNSPKSKQNELVEAEYVEAEFAQVEVPGRQFVTNGDIADNLG
jgi:hypothetical protein